MQSLRRSSITSVGRETSRFTGAVFCGRLTEMATGGILNLAITGIQQLELIAPTDRSRAAARGTMFILVTTIRLTRALQCSGILRVTRRFFNFLDVRPSGKSG